MSGGILVLNAGSSSIKFQLYAREAGAELHRRFKGEIDGIGTRPRLAAVDDSGAPMADASFPAEAMANVPAALDWVLGWIEDKLRGEMPEGVGHRVVHGGTLFSAPVLVDEALLESLEQLVPLAPLHQPNNLAAIRAIRRRRPNLPQVACFDTAFHRAHPDVADRFAIPAVLHGEGVRRYGFHGLSYEYIAGELARLAPELATGRVVVAHLGSGASMCAMLGGKSVDSTMAFTPLDGLPMGTRPGQIDPGVLLYLVQQKGFDGARLERFLYHECGLKGLSGLSNDMRDLLASPSAEAKRAVDYFIYRALREAGALAAVLGGIDGIVFTAGIGERAPAIRAGICAGLAGLGLDIDEDANSFHGPRISRPGSRVQAWVIPTDEEWMIARHTCRILDRAI